MEPRLIGYRKFLVTLMAMASADLALWLGKLDGTAWATLTAGLVAGFMALNMAAKAKA